MSLDVAEADGFGQRVDIGLRAGKKMPAIGGFRAAIALQISALLGRGQIRGLGGIDADHDNVEVLAGSEPHHLESAGEAVELFRAEHGALVVDQRQDGRLLAEVTGQRHLFSRVVSKREAEWQLRVEPLIDADAVQD